MVYVSIKNISDAADKEKVKRCKVVQYGDNKDFIDAILSRKNTSSQQNSIEAYSLLDEMLASLTDIKKAVLRRSENGKPYIENEKVSFNLTHTDGAVACIINTDGGDVGIDVELIGRDGQKIIDRFFDETAKQKYALSENKPLEFARIWTEKESFVKYTGTGLSDYRTDYPPTCKFTSFRSGDVLVTACTDADATVRVWQNDED